MTVLSDDLASLIGDLQAAESCLARAKLRAVAAYDRAEHWQADGCTDMAAWVQAWLNVSAPTARMWVEVARGLEQLPHIAEAFESGALSLEQVAQLVRFATPETDAVWASMAAGMTPVQLEREAK